MQEEDGTLRVRFLLFVSRLSPGGHWMLRVHEWREGAAYAVVCRYNAALPLRQNSIIFIPSTSFARRNSPTKKSTDSTPTSFHINNTSHTWSSLHVLIPPHPPQLLPHVQLVPLLRETMHLPIPDHNFVRVGYIFLKMRS